MPDYAKTVPQAVEKIAFLGDVHADTRFTVKAITRSKELGADIIVQLGDFGYDYDWDFLDAVEAALKHTGLQMIFVDGNHDDHRFLRTDYDGNARLRIITPHLLHAGRGYRWQWDGVRFLAVGGAHSVDRQTRLRYGWMWHREEILTDGQIADAIAGGQTDVLISHDCPAGVTIPGLQPELFPAFEIAAADHHRTRMRTIVDAVQPTTIYHGHYHVNYDQRVDFGWGRAHVYGLADNGAGMAEALDVVALAELRR